jgi:short-subunit dehydrogenase
VTARPKPASGHAPRAVAAPLSSDTPGTAVVTGASSGLGEVFARELASRGYDLVLVARRAGILRAFAREWRQAHGVRVDVWPADLSDDAAIAALADRIAARKDITLLINNAGFGHGGRFYEVDFRPQRDMMHVHMIATAHLTRAVLPQMVERNRGAVINVASVAAFAIVAGNAMYDTTKCWTVKFSLAMAEELRGTGVKIQALCPGFTHTGFHSAPVFEESYKRFDIPGFLWGTSEKVVAASLGALRRKKVVVIPVWYNKILALAPRLPFGQTLTRISTRKRV